ncbi:glucan endo-1,3-beta-glucosidase 13 [Mangifera indica]|uniref:glucan endo-1,3-beta-glucosidase 13 n=1 Tax=Mangifera indica TaxID=29780 RepID=UPI001CFABB34|nr:glucan endo-1,3-beta-glucosidase 13 [Mangifera indica]
MLKMKLLFQFFLICLLGLTVTGQESFQLLNLYDTSSPGSLQASSHSALPIAVSVSVDNLNEISGSVLVAESWLRNYVLAHYPASKITTIVVGNNVLCQKEQKHNWVLILPALKNIYYSLTRWGLQRDIKVSPAFSSNCLQPHLAEKFMKPLLKFLLAANSTFSLNPPPMLNLLSDKATTNTFVSSQFESIKSLGFLTPNTINVLIHIPREAKPRSRKLSDSDSKVINPYPARPTPLPEISPIHSSIGYSIPAHVVKSPQPPLSHSTSSPPLTFPSDSPPPLTFPSDSPPPLTFPSDSPPPMPFYMAPEVPPETFPAPPPYGLSSPPCNPIDNTVAPSPEPTGVVQSLWCVAKPSVPAETLQEAMDYACGDGGADCAEIVPNGRCFYPDTVVAHASYAFNSYWQKNKRNGGTCSFGGTAMVINADPSYLHCRFVLS